MTAIAPPNVLASVDLGSNSFRLQVCENINGQLKIIDSFKQMVRFAAGLDEHKNLDQASQERALNCLEKFGERLRQLNPWMRHNVRSFTILQPVADLVEALNGYAPTVIATYPTVAALLADEADRGSDRGGGALDPLALGGLVCCHCVSPRMGPAWCTPCRES